MKYKDIQVQVDDHIATLLLDRPEKRNALSLNTLEEMIHALEDLATQQEVRVAVLRRLLAKSLTLVFWCSACAPSTSAKSSHHPEWDTKLISSA